MVGIVTVIDSALVQGQIQKVLISDPDSWALYQQVVDFAPWRRHGTPAAGRELRRARRGGLPSSTGRWSWRRKISAVASMGITAVH